MYCTECIFHHNYCRLFTASIYVHHKQRKSNLIEANAVHAMVGVGFANEASKMNSETVDILTYQALIPVITLLLTAPLMTN